jgi:hypothetical protein
MGGRGSKGRSRVDRDAPGQPPVEPPSVAPDIPTPLPVSGEMSETPIAYNGWGEDPNAPLNYHSDGPIGTALQHMDQDAHMDVDGEPLANVVGRVATEVTVGGRTAQQGIDEIRTIRDRLPDNSRARSELDHAISRMDAPPSPVPAVPATAPEPLRVLVNELHTVPMVRNDPSTEMAPLVGILNDFNAGRIGGPRMVRAVQDLANKRHESLGDSGKFQIDRAVKAAVTALKQLPPDGLRSPTTRQ